MMVATCDIWQAPEAVLLAGPTASGKSGLALHLARRHGGVIVNADSMQVYADLQVLSARPGAEALADAPHRLYGHVDGSDAYSVARWRAEAGSVLATLRRQGALPILVGGTGLYFKAAERGLAWIPPISAEIQARIRADAQDVGAETLHARLAALDPETAARLRPSDPQRIVRALEVLAATGRPLARWQAEPALPALVDPARCVRVFLAPDRARLRARIDQRFDAMLAGGALAELETLAARGLDPALPVMRALGVPQLLAGLRGAMPWPEAVFRAKAETRQYAKRQFTWFRNQAPGWSWIEPETALAALEQRLARP